MRFVARHRLLVALALVVGGWQACHNAALVVQILFATRTLGLSRAGAWACAIPAWASAPSSPACSATASAAASGRGRCLVLGIAICGCGWLLLALAPADAWGVAAFALMLMHVRVGAVLIFINFLALRQAVTPAPLLGRMTSTMRWLILMPAGPGRVARRLAGRAFGPAYVARRGRLRGPAAGARRVAASK